MANVLIVFCKKSHNYFKKETKLLRMCYGTIMKSLREGNTFVSSLKACKLQEV